MQGSPFSEGTQPFGISRPVRLLITDNVRVEWFGTYLWCPKLSESSALCSIWTEVKNYSAAAEKVMVRSELLDALGKVLTKVESERQVAAGQIVKFEQLAPEFANPHLWSVDDPYLHTLRTSVLVNGKPGDTCLTTTGLRWFDWPPKSRVNYFRLNGKQVFIRGAAEYEMMLGNDHAFGDEQIDTECSMHKSLGFNAFRDAHHPHNRRYYDNWDRMGILCWPQITANTEFNNDEYRKNYMVLLREFIRERRNHPSVVLWGLHNEGSPLEAGNDFNTEVMNAIVELDPICPSQRLRVNCKGQGSDWNIPQEWSGQYGGDYHKYYPSNPADRKLGPGSLIGEYGCARRIGDHIEPSMVTSGKDNIDGIARKTSETYVCDLHEHKIRRGETMYRNEFCGHFLWSLVSFSNPGRSGREKEGGGDDAIGPINNKGLLTIYRRPADAFYLYKALYTTDKKDPPFVYIVSHTWPDRWKTAGKKNDIWIYSNCEEVELFNDYKDHSLGKHTAKPFSHFEWDNADIQYNVLYAEASSGGGNVVASDIVMLNNLPKAPNLDRYDHNPKNTTKGEDGHEYLFRVNCNGNDYTDTNGNVWKADRNYSNGAWGSLSWSEVFSRGDKMSRGQTYDPITGTSDDALYKTFRYGRNMLKYKFDVPGGTYGVELHFIEPWYGTGGDRDGRGWRIFDIALENEIVVNDLDIFAIAGHDHALKIVKNVVVADGILDIDFPEIKANQAVISAIAIAKGNLTPVAMHTPRILPPTIQVSRFSLLITFHSPQSHRIDIYNLAGRVISKIEGQGSKHYVVSASKLRLGSGLFIVKARCGSWIVQKKTFLIR